MGTSIGSTLQRGGGGSSPFPVAVQNDLRLPFVIVADIAARNNIEEWRRMSNMECYVISDPGGNNRYQLGVDTTLAGQNWTPTGGPFQRLSEKNQPGGYVGLEVDGYVDPVYIKSIYAQDYYTPEDETERFGLTTRTGDLARQLDNNRVYIKINNNPAPTIAADWADITTSVGISSVNGDSGPDIIIDIVGLLAYGSNQTEFDAAVAANSTVSALGGAVATNTSNIQDLFNAVTALQNKTSVNIPVYNPATQYQAGNNVLYDTGSGSKSLYRCHKQPPVGTDPTDVTYWELIAGGGGTSLTKSTTVQAQVATDDATYMTPLTSYEGWFSWIVNKTVSALNTTVKNIVGAINELKTRIDNIGDVGGGSGTGVFEPVQDITELKALNTTDGAVWKDKWALIVEDEESWYRYDRDSAVSESLPKIVAPTTGVGRWIKTSGASLASEVSYDASAETGGNLPNTPTELQTSVKQVRDWTNSNALDKVSPNPVALTGELDLSQKQVKPYSDYDLSVSGTITFSLGGNAIPFGVDYFRLISDGATPFAVQANFNAVFNEKYNVPNDYILPAGTYEVFCYKTPSGVTMSIPGYSVSSTGTQLPQIKNVIAIGSDGNANLAWDPPSGLADNLSVLRSEASGGPYTEIGTPLANAINFNDNTVVNGTTYYYVIKEVGDGTTYSDSSNSQQVNLTPAVGLIQLSKLTIGTIAPQTGQVLIPFTNPNGGLEDSNLVQYREQGATTWINGVSAISGATNVTQDGLTDDTYYNFRIIAIGDGVTYVNSEASTLVTAVVGTILDAIANLKFWADFSDVSVITVDGNDKITAMTDKSNLAAAITTTGGGQVYNELEGYAEFGDLVNYPRMLFNEISLDEAGFTYFIVVKINDVKDNAVLGGTDDGSVSRFRFRNNTIQMNLDNNLVTQGYPNDLNKQMITISCISNSLKCYKNNNLSPSFDADVSGGAAGDYFINRLGNGSSGFTTNHFNGKIYQVYMVDRLLDDIERANVRDAINNLPNVGIW
jgi:hypothetical protein